MKTIRAMVISFIVLLVAAANLIASQRVVVAEDFTGTWCQYCPAAANGLDQLYNEVGDSLIVLAFHYGDTYQTTETLNRNYYYSVDTVGWPSVIFDGTEWMVGSDGSGSTFNNYNYYRPIFDAHKTIASPFEMTVALTAYDLEARTGTASIIVKNIDTVAQSGILHFVVVERNSPYPQGWFGLYMVDFVVRDMIPDENGETINIAAGESLVVTRNYALAQNWALGSCQFVAFVQRGSQDIIQGAELRCQQSLVQKRYTTAEFGNGNGFYEPAETLKCAAYVQEYFADGTGAKVIAWTPDTFVTIPNGLWDIGSIVQDDSANNAADPFQVIVKPSATMNEGHQVTVFLTKQVYNTLYNDTISVVDSFSFLVGTPVTIYTEGFEAGRSNWADSGIGGGVDWDTTSAEAHTGGVCITDSKAGNYANVQSRYIWMINGIDLTAMSSAMITWYEKYNMLTNDYCRPELSVNGSTTFIPLTTAYSGTAPSWQKRLVNISNYLNTDNFRLRFRLTSNSADVADGWQVDDIAITGYFKTMSIWPGDCDNNNVVNALDILPIGIYWNSAGMPRPSASTVWSAQFAYMWPMAAACYADCDGNGTVNVEDVLSIGQNWRLSHSKTEGASGDMLIPENIDLSPYLDNYRKIYQGLSGESEAVLEMKRVLESIFSRYLQTPQQFSMNICPAGGYGIWRIECNMPRDTKLSLKIYNIMGQEVKTLNNGPVKAGQHSWVWPGVNNEQRKVSSGLYLCRLEASGYSKTVKMVLVR